MLPSHFPGELLSILEELGNHCATMQAAFLCKGMKCLKFCNPQAGLAFTESRESEANPRGFGETHVCLFVCFLGG